MKIVSRPIFERGVAAMERKHFARAHRCLLKVFRINKRDEAAKYLLGLCREAMLAIQVKHQRPQLIELTHNIDGTAQPKRIRAKRVEQKND